MGEKYVTKDRVSIDYIRKAAGWTVASQTFARFHRLPLCNDQCAFTKVVLDNKEVLVLFSSLKSVVFVLHFWFICYLKICPFLIIH